MTATPHFGPMNAERYHQDPCVDPSLSASIAHLLCTSSPLHAWTAHPKLNPNFARVDETKFDVGVCAHALLLEGRSAVMVVDADDWRTKEARDLRANARAEGKIPLLAHTFAEVEAMVAAAREQLAAHHAEPPLFADGKPEQTITWEEVGGVMCRARLDWLRDDRRAVDDYKSTSRSANPEAYSRALFAVGGDIQAAFYIRAVETATGVTPSFRWAVQETTPPYALSVVAPSPAILQLAEKKVAYAIGRWEECLATGEWPGYATEVAYADLPPWEESRWLEKEERELIA